MEVWQRTWSWRFESSLCVKFIISLDFFPLGYSKWITLLSSTQSVNKSSWKYTFKNRLLLESTGCWEGQQRSVQFNKNFQCFMLKETEKYSAFLFSFHSDHIMGRCSELWINCRKNKKILPWPTAFPKMLMWVRQSSNFFMTVK